MQTEKIDSDLFYQIETSANGGSYLHNEVTLLTPNLQHTELAQDAAYLVIDSAYTLTIMRLDSEGRPVAILESE